MTTQLDYRATNNGRMTSDYARYQNMIQRCTNPLDTNYKNYGFRGITVCDAWLTSYANYLNDMGHCPEGMQLDRIDNNLGYSKDNCRFVSRSENQLNKRKYEHKCNTLTPKDIQFIRDSTMKQKQIADAIGISVPMVSMIKAGKRYAN